MNKINHNEIIAYYLQFLQFSPSINKVKFPTKLSFKNARGGMKALLSIL